MAESAVGEAELERRIVEPPPGDAAARDALRCLVRLRGEGRPLAGIAAAFRDETGLALSDGAVGRVLARVAGTPAAREEGADPAHFSGWLGGG